MAQTQTAAGSPLAEEVYRLLKERLDRGQIQPGEFLDLAALAREQQMSKTPLRDAVIRLEAEGFVSVYPRRGVMVKELTLRDIRELYELIGGLEAQAALLSRARFGREHADELDALDRAMGAALKDDDFDAYYRANLAFHDVYIALADNRELSAALKVRKERLYDFPRRSGYVREWELASVKEHRQIAKLFRAGDFDAAARYIRDVHWSFAVQERYIKAYYMAARVSV
jgi:DNA-binding GntR family transcriptional regulator